MAPARSTTMIALAAVSSTSAELDLAAQVGEGRAPLRRGDGEREGGDRGRHEERLGERADRLGPESADPRRRSEGSAADARQGDGQDTDDEQLDRDRAQPEAQGAPTRTGIGRTRAGSAWPGLKTQVVSPTTTTHWTRSSKPGRRVRRVPTAMPRGAKTSTAAACEAVTADAVARNGPPTPMLTVSPANRPKTRAPASVAARRFQSLDRRKRGLPAAAGQQPVDDCHLGGIGHAEAQGHEGRAPSVGVGGRTGDEDAHDEEPGPCTPCRREQERHRETGCRPPDGDGRPGRGEAHRGRPEDEDADERQGRRHPPARAAEGRAGHEGAPFGASVPELVGRRGASRAAFSADLIDS